jgi:hypothetical protein
MTNSFAWVSHDRGRSEELVREREKACWDWLFRGKKPDDIEQKLNDVLPVQVRAVLVPSRVSIIIVNLTDPVEMVGAIREVLHAMSALYDVELTVWHSDTQNESLPMMSPLQRRKGAVSPREQYCFEILFGGMGLKDIVNKLNIVWLNDDIKAVFISANKSIIIVDKKDPVSIVTQAQELLRTINSGYDIKLVEAPKTKLPLMQAV